MNRLVVFFNDRDTEGTQEGGEWSYRDRGSEGTGVNVGAGWCVPVLSSCDRERESLSAKCRLVCPHAVVAQWCVPVAPHPLAPRVVCPRCFHLSPLLPVPILRGETSGFRE